MAIKQKIISHSRSGLLLSEGSQDASCGGKSVSSLQGPEIDFLKNAAVFHHRPELLDLLSPDFVILKVLKGII
jgi:hypothetical protein